MQPETAPKAFIKKTMRVAVPIDRAFRVFVDRMGAWWPAQHHIGATPFKDILVEHRAGGRWYELSANGQECQWGTVLVWDPPKRVTLSWHLQADWTVNFAPERSSEVVVEFFEEGPEATRMEFEHRHLERHGEGFEKLRDSVDSGWGEILRNYEALATSEKE
jgi:uncharacterized protein YndB with AHSA1/START domain